MWQWLSEQNHNKLILFMRQGNKSVPPTPPYLYSNFGGNVNNNNLFERNVYRRIPGPVYENENENWRILTDKEVEL
jgi:hypothetical protein